MTVMEFSRENELKYASRAEGREEGREEGLEKGIIKSIRLLAKVGMSKLEIVKEIRDEFELSEESTQKYVEENYPVIH